MTKNLTKLLFLGLAVSFPALHADTLMPPGSANIPATTTTITGDVLLATASGAVTFPVTPNPLSANFTEWVYKDPSPDLACPTGGCLDFVYQFTDTTKGASATYPGVIERMTGSSYTGFLTDVGYVATTGKNSGGSTADIAPNATDRSALPGDVVAFDFQGVANVTPGEESDLLVIKTDAHNYAVGTIGIQDGVAGSAVGFAPSSVPEPVTMGLLGGGLALLGIARWRRSLGKKD